MSSTHEPPQLLEPSNLLEPLDLKHQHTDFADRLARGESGEAGARPQPRFTRKTPRVPRPSEAGRRSPVKSILLAAGALACFGAGTLFSQIQSLTPADVGSSPTIASANRAPAPLAEVVTKTDESTPTEGKSASSNSNEQKPDAASNVAATPPTATSLAEQNGSATAQGAPAAQPTTNDAVAGCAGSCKQQPCPPDDANCLEGGAPSPAKDLTKADGSAATPAKTVRPARQAASAQSADSERADISASSREEERTQSFRHSKRAAQRETIDQPSGSKRKVATGGGAGHRQDGNRASGSRRDFASNDGMPPANSSGRWQSRDANQASNGWWGWTADDNVLAPRFSSRTENDQAVNWHRDRAGEGRRQEREQDRTSSRRRDRSDEYGRDDDRRVRAGRDDFLMGRAERNEGPLMKMGPPTRYPW
jgi:hypothetical protein